MAGTESQSYFPGAETWFIVSRSVLVFLIISLGIVGNGFVLWFYGKNKKLTGQVYILALAVIDLVCCVVMTPQMPLIELQIIQEYFIINVITNCGIALEMVGYFGVQLTMALDQFIAVFWPFQHARLRRDLNRGMVVCGAILSMLLAVASNSFTLLGYDHIPYVIMILILATVTLVTLLTVYPITAYKIYRQNVTVRPQLQIELKTPGKSGGITTKHDQGNASHLHVQALKIYTAILLQFLLASIVSFAGLVIFDKIWMAYFFFINHTCNPAIYYCFVPKFREGVKTRARYILQ